MRWFHRAADPHRVARRLLFVALLSAVGCSDNGGRDAGRTLPTRWLALGDSFSAGEGVAGATGVCQRSPSAYAALAAEELSVPTIAMVACTGAEISDLHGQVDEGLRTLGGPPELVTLTMGGNDVGFFPVLLRCITDTVGPCAIDDDAVRARIDVVVTELERAYGRIAREVLAPGGLIVVVGYPNLFADPDQWPDAEGEGCDGFRKQDAEVIRGLAGRLNDAVEEATSSVGAEFVAVAPLFDDHSRCGPEEPWLHGLSLGVDEGTFRAQSSFHPNSAGHRAIADLLVERLRQIYSGS